MRQRQLVSGQLTVCVGLQKSYGRGLDKDSEEADSEERRLDDGQDGRGKERV